MAKVELAPTRSLRTGVAAFAVGLVVAGCGTQPIASMEARRSPPAPEPKLSSPLAAYMLSWRELTLINHARSVLLSTCLAEAGYYLPTGDLEAKVERARSQEASDLSRMYGITDRTVAAVHGYWPPPAVPAEPVPAIATEVLDQCVGTADRGVGRKEGRSPYGIARELLIKSRSRLEDQPAAVAAVRDWTACMANAGHRVTSPLNDEGDIARELRSRQQREARGRTGPSPRELALAAADITCKEATNTVSRLAKVGEQLDLEVVRTHRSELAASRRRLTLVLARIRNSGSLSATDSASDRPGGRISPQEGAS